MNFTNIHFKQLRPQHSIFAKCPILKGQRVFSTVAIIEGAKRTLYYWECGTGLIPLHEQKDLKGEFDYRRILKKQLRAI